MEIKGFRLEKSSENFKVFEPTSHVSYFIGDFLRLCEIQSRMGYEYAGMYQSYLIFKKTTHLEENRK